VKVYLEISKRRTFASAIDWPGWCRAGKTEDEALAALLEYGTRYKKVLGGAGRNLAVPDAISGLNVVERLEGNATTEFGAPGVIPDVDRESVSDAELDRQIALLKECWRAFDSAAAAAGGDELGPSGPRGGGRALDKIRDHVRGAEVGYVRAVGGTVPGGEGADWPTAQRAFIEALRSRAHGELPDRGPRGGERWPAPFGIRRSAWHALDHAWEIEDRSQATVETRR
jgi:hypothetical protein